MPWGPRRGHSLKFLPPPPYIKDLLSFTLLIIQHDQLISLCDLNVCKFINKNRPVELPVSIETLVYAFFLLVYFITMPAREFLCCLQSIVAHRDHFVQRPSVCVSGSPTFLVVRRNYVSQATHAFLGMLPLCLYIWRVKSLPIVTKFVIFHKLF